MLFPLLSPSFWPLFVSISSLSLVSGVLMLLSQEGSSGFVISLGVVATLSSLWWSDLSRESVKGTHSLLVMDLLKGGMALFILSEVMFFLSWFWAYFHNMTEGSLNALVLVDPLSIPTLNTLLLLSSGAFVTLAHHAFLESMSPLPWMGGGIIYGVLFTLLQGGEYLEMQFSISDSFFGSSFFVTTGFHGIHVIVGTLFLGVIFLRMILLSLSSDHHVGLECSLWYWHFVDVVWLFLYSSMYWWE